MGIEDICFEQSDGTSLPFTSIYQFVRYLGSGSFGDVYEVVRISSGLRMALKIVDKDCSDFNKIVLLRHEAKILEECDHPNIVQFYYLDEYVNYLVMAIELCELGSVKQYMHSLPDKAKVDDLIASKITKGILHGLEYLHERNTFHRDLKPDNVLLSGNAQSPIAKICDFGLAKKLDPGMDGLVSELCGTLLYKAPEQLLGKFYSKAVDIWATGFIMFEMLNRQRPIEQSSRMKDTEYIALFNYNNGQDIFTIPSDFEKTIACDFFKRACNFHQGKRYRAIRALKHPWITRNKNDKIPKSFYEEMIRDYELEELFKTTQNVLFSVSVLSKLPSPDPDYVKKLQAAVNGTETPTEELSQKYSTSTLTESDMTKVSSNDHNKTRQRNFRISLKKTKAKRAKTGLRKSIRGSGITKKSVRIKKSKPRHPVTREKASRVKLMDNPTQILNLNPASLHSVEGLRKRSTEVSTTIKSQTRIPRVTSFKINERVNKLEVNLYRSFERATKGDKSILPDIESKKILKSPRNKNPKNQSLIRRERAMNEHLTMNDSITKSSLCQHMVHSSLKKAKKISKIRKGKMMKSNDSFIEYADEEVHTITKSPKKYLSKKRNKEHGIINFYRKTTKASYKTKKVKNLYQNTPLKPGDLGNLKIGDNKISLFKYIKENDLFRSAFKFKGEKESRNLKVIKYAKSAKKSHLGAFKEYL
ncbi:unnamed protein product [Moneuplotes crassus]|uniref:Protein kinase domain-containing protein n=1 Tax=Euplotes crassus TaxID=5936 RepID=A0AAD1XZ12_EUPCR|nr:unnamed protein product [Moneuplotes crassus]